MPSTTRHYGGRHFLHCRNAGQNLPSESTDVTLFSNQLSAANGGPELQVTIISNCTCVASGLHSAVARRCVLYSSGIIPAAMGERWLGSGVIPRACHAPAIDVFHYSLAIGLNA